jgi:hypothetical protein
MKENKKIKEKLQKSNEGGKERGKTEEDYKRKENEEEEVE